MNTFHIFRTFKQISKTISLEYRHISAFSGVCREIPTKFHQNIAEKMQNSTQKIGKNSICLAPGRLRESFFLLFDDASINTINLFIDINVRITILFGSLAAIL